MDSFVCQGFESVQSVGSNKMDLGGIVLAKLPAVTGALMPSSTMVRVESGSSSRPPRVRAAAGGWSTRGAPGQRWLPCPRGAPARSGAMVSALAVERVETSRKWGIWDESAILRVEVNSCHHLEGVTRRKPQMADLQC
eukprot:1195284-Prorocentrum_minimum.AAC.9